MSEGFDSCETVSDNTGGELPKIGSILVWGLECRGADVFGSYNDNYLEQLRGRSRVSTPHVTLVQSVLDMNMELESVYPSD